MDSHSYTHSPLPEGFRVNDYTIEQVLGNPGAFGITYSAFDRSDQRVAMKELFPCDTVLRQLPDQSVIADSPDAAEFFQEAKRMFRNEADLLAQLRHPNIVRIENFFEANGTAYLVMKFEYGQDLSTHLKMQAIRPNQNELLKLLLPILDGLEEAHRIGCLHRDIKPANIYITKDHRPFLLDFGAARIQVMGRPRKLTTIVTPGFAPFEQYTSTLRQGPWTDIYALGAVMHVAMGQGVPTDAFSRADDDDYHPLAERLAESEYSPAFLRAIDWALSLHAKDRPQSIEEWRQRLTERNLPPVAERSVRENWQNTDGAEPADSKTLLTWVSELTRQRSFFYLVLVFSVTLFVLLCAWLFG